MTESKILYGQAYIVRRGIDDSSNKEGKVIYSLVQDQFLVVPSQAVAKNTIELVGNLVNDLKSEGTYKWNGKKYFYWEYQMTDTTDDDVVTTEKFECPPPRYFGDNFFKDTDTIDTVQGDYSKYWIQKIETARENFEYKEAIQKKEIIFPKTQYVNSNGELVKVDEIRVANTDLGDITNLLGLF